MMLVARGETMQNGNLKIGIIQNFPATADFSGNLRRIVQGYRECLDHGAELIIAPATALCGLAPLSLTGRRSFMMQTRAALDALAAELSNVPLLLGAYAPLLPDEADAWARTLPDFATDPLVRVESATPAMSIVPFELRNNSVKELPDAGLSRICGLNAYVDINDEPTLLDDKTQAELIIHLSTGAWHRHSRPSEQKKRRWEATHNHCPVICCHAVGTAEGMVYGGGSSAVSEDGRELLLMPAFREKNSVFSLGCGHSCGHVPAEGAGDETSQLRDALLRGLLDSARSHAVEGACLCLDHENAPLLAHLAAKAFGAQNVLGVSFGHPAMPAEQLGINSLTMELSPLLRDLPAVLDEAAREAMEARLRGGLLASIAEQKGVLLLSSLSRHDIMTGDFTLYGESCAHLLPFGDLYESDLAALRRSLHLPSSPTRSRESADAKARLTRLDNIIHELANLNHSPGALINLAADIYPENEVRYVQRRMATSEESRRQLPPVLRVAPDAQQLAFPVRHRLDD